MNQLCICPLLLMQLFLLDLINNSFALAFILNRMCTRRLTQQLDFSCIAEIQITDSARFDFQSGFKMPIYLFYWWH